MNMKKIMSIAAMTLAITCSTSITTFAAQNDAGNKTEAAKDIAVSFYTGKQVVNNVEITINTPIKDYAKKELLDEIAGLNIAEFDANLGIRANLDRLMEGESSFANTENLTKIKEYIKDKLQDFIDASEKGNLEAEVGKYIEVSKYGKLTIGKNMDGKTTLSLESTLQKTRGNILLQVNSDEVKEAKAKVSQIKSKADLKAIIKDILNINF